MRPGAAPSNLGDEEEVEMALVHGSGLRRIIVVIPPTRSHHP